MRSNGRASKRRDAEELTTKIMEIMKGVESGLASQVIGCAIEVHRHLGPGLLESAYESCLCTELAIKGIPFKREIPLEMRY